MVEKNVINDFQTFFVSRELCISPIFEDIIEFCRKIGEKRFEELKFSISVSYGKRILINSNEFDIESLKQEDIIEIVDYDPIKNLVLVIGKKYPIVETPIHWMIQKARHDVNAVVIIYDKKIFEYCNKHFPKIEDIKSACIIEKIKLILKTLQKSKILCLNDKGVLIVGLQLKEVEDELIKIFEDLK